MTQSRKKSRQRKAANNIDLHCGDESLGLVNVFDEASLQSRHTARWAIRSKFKSRQRKRKFLRKQKRRISSLSDDESLSSSSDDDETKRIKPTHSIAIRVNNPHIHSGVKIVQDKIVTHNEKLKPALIPLATLHLTLLVVHLEDEEQIQKATETLHQCRSILESMTLKFKGLYHFGHTCRVLFVKPYGKENIKWLKKVRKTFSEKGIPSTDSRKFIPHLTVMNLNRLLRRQGINIYSTCGVLTDCADLNFGEERVTGLHLCSMNKKDKDGFYKCVASVNFDADNEAGSA